MKIGFVLASNSRTPLASTRVFALNMFPYLAAAGYEPQILHEPTLSAELPDVSGLANRTHRQGIKVVIFQKVHGMSVVDEARKLSSVGVKTIYGVCDLIENVMAEATDATVVV